MRRRGGKNGGGRKERDQREELDGGGGEGWEKRNWMRTRGMKEILQKYNLH